MFRRRTATLLAATLATASIALPAWAHASFDKSQVPAEAEVDLTFRAPQERASTNERIEALAPKEWTVLSCTAPLNWTCTIDEDAEAPRTVLTWEADGATAVPEINFAFRVRTPNEDQQGVYAWPVIQTYADGHEAAWIGDLAPTIQVGDSDAPVVDNDEESAEPHQEPSTGGAASPAPTSTPAPEASSSPQPTAAGDTDDGSAGTDDGAASDPVEAGGDEDADAPASGEAAQVTSTDQATGSVDDVAAAPEAEAVEDTSDAAGRPTGIIVAVIAMAALGGAAFVARGRFGA